MIMIRNRKVREKKMFSSGLCVSHVDRSSMAVLSPWQGPRCLGPERICWWQRKKKERKGEKSCALTLTRTPVSGTGRICWWQRRKKERKEKKEKIRKAVISPWQGLQCLGQDGSVGGRRSKLASVEASSRSGKAPGFATAVIEFKI